MIEYQVSVSPDGAQEWRLPDGYLHRTDGPARTWANGTQEWFLNGQLHRTDGPAVICADGTQEWYQNGRMHRADGPAVFYANGHQEWWIKGKKLTEREFLALTKTKDTSCAGRVIEIDGVKYQLTPI